MKCEKCGNEVVTTTRYQSGRFCSRRCANSRTFTSNTKRKKSAANKGQVPWNKGNVAINKKICTVCGSEFEVLGWSKRKTCSDICKRSAPGQGGYRLNSTRKTRCIYKGYQMDSGSELEFAQLLDEHKIAWKKNTTKWFPYRDISGKMRKYFPDFYLPKYDYWVEIKGLFYLNENDSLKLKAVGDNIEMQMHNQIRLPKCVIRQRV